MNFQAIQAINDIEDLFLIFPPSPKPTTDSRIPESPFPLLELPLEVRNMVYEHVLFASARRVSFVQELLGLDPGAHINTDILLASRQLFEEARNVLIGAQLVLVRMRGLKPARLQSTAVMKDRIPLFHPIYRQYCLLEHNIDDHKLYQWDRDHAKSFVLRKEDVFRFCGGIPGLDPDSYVPQMLSKITHTLKLLNPEDRRPQALANVPIRVPSHRRLLEEYQKALAGCRDVVIIIRSSLERNDGITSSMISALQEMLRKISLSNSSRFCSGDEWDW